MNVVLDYKLPFEIHLNNVLAKVSKIIGLLRKRRNLLSTATLIVKLSFDPIWAMVMFSAIKLLKKNCIQNLPGVSKSPKAGMSKEKVYQEWGLKSL